MDLDDIRQLMWKWGSEVGYNITYCPPEAKFITGKSSQDAQLHYFTLDSGIEVKLTEDFKNITGYDIIDAEKFTWFALRYS